MARETLQNFATSQVAGSTLTSGGTSFSVTSGAGPNFPSTNFLVTIDTEILLIASRSGDTFTIASGGRGYDGTTAASHSVGATVQSSIAAYNINHLWQNTQDAYQPDVPPVQSLLSATGVPNGSAGTYDNEFETAGSWTLYPSSPGSGSIWTAGSGGSGLRSHLTFYRSLSDSATYTAYIAFPVSGAFTVTAKVSDAPTFLYNSPSVPTTNFFVSDQTNPTTFGGNRAYISIQDYYGTSGNDYAYTARYVSPTKVLSGTATAILPAFPIPLGQTIYLRMVTNGSGTWNYFMGDGVTYGQIATVSSLSFTPQSMGMQFVTVGSTSTSVAVDWIRFQTGIASSFGQ